MSNQESAQYWVKLERRNDWGTSYYAKPGITDKMSNIREQEIHWEVGQPARVRFPDGTIRILPLASETVNASYGDHGHYHPGTCELPGVTIDYHGVQLFVPLSALEVVAEDWKSSDPRK